MNDIAIKSVLNYGSLRTREEATPHRPIEITHLSEFHQRAGVLHRPPPVSKTLQDRMANARQRTIARLPAAPRGATHRGENAQLRAAAIDLVEALHGGEQTLVEERLAAQYDPLERHTLLRSARDEIEASTLGADEKDRLTAQLNGMIADLMDEHGDQVRAGLRDMQAFESALDTMHGLAEADGKQSDANTPDALRKLYGKAEGGKLEPFTPLALMQSLQNKFGAENVGTALAELRSKMSAGLRSREATGPRLWLSLSDAACFNAIQSGIAIAAELRRMLSERAHLVAKAGDTATAVALLEAAGAGCAAEALADRIIERNGLAALQLMQMYMLTRQALERLAITAWQDEAYRRDLLEKLRELACGASSRQPSPHSKEEQLEARLRGNSRRINSRSDDDARDGANDESRDDNADEEEPWNNS